MVVHCTYYRLGHGIWGGQRNLDASLGAGAHAERLAMQYSQDGDVILLVQNAFPCQDRASTGAPGCHEYLQQCSRPRKKLRGITTLVRVDHDHGAYSMAHPIVMARQPARLSLTPCVIYYQNGQVSYHFNPNFGLPQLPNIWDKPQAAPG